LAASAKNKDIATEDATDDGPLRLCALTRTQKPVDELIRFVLAPDGCVVPDLARRLPGRGVWITATRQDVAAAARQRVFARSLKRPARVPQDLPGQVERLLVARLTQAISIANKAGLVVAGFGKVEEALDKGKAAVLVHAAEAAADGVSKLDRKFRALAPQEAAAPSIVRDLGSAELSLAMGRPNVIHAAASEGGATRKILQEARRLRFYRGGADDWPLPSALLEP
jgi:predicted RNA-binding protein YlxR (DUF448 family)